ncbi:NAD(P)-dependent dehydrogenase (short-subunit alcohol dehydrogenase family) [Bacillus mesophilus]|uniref:Glucose 1-dehydrogenase n=1 Tax=Bacillus mesophilus TaxID=1808955 RepID=A0A6M0Q789_9BACI|nr:glucose 1-dehydrogenase [Bacillus mesophilus]MBM7661557.1 NAD(P)-dependent dehydrogenase (short-subunit alcohol dehydrogenase family) [Bacillus mesophilus]NEY72226.1 glucose 1-dehydrogenase [Bacillus mesophilus]
MSFQNKVVIVTGAANGIGKAISQLYAEKGAKVVLADLDEAAGKAHAEHINNSGGEAIFVLTDVRREEDLLRLMQETKSAFNQIDILVNNAGKSEFKSPYELTIEEWDDIIHTNLRSVFLGSREAAKYMRENKDGGAIINIASTRAIMSEPFSEAYAATKGGIVSLTHALAASFGEDHITVNAISPGWIETGDYSTLRGIDHEQHLSKRVGTPEDIARACLYLSAKENDFVTGINLIVDGGMTRKMIYEE